ncbi:MAG: amino acid ABC transporter permease [Clostridiales bacterium]|jgi:polar amino acid transport system permease protein|nr:amino acid ABC transporter permease [Clostridiales bacterium]
MQDMGVRVLFEGANGVRLLKGLWTALRISLLSMAFSFVLGTLLGCAMTLKNPVVKAAAKIYLEFIRIMPQLVLLFLAYFGMTKAFGIQLSGYASALIVFTMWGTAEMGDLVRGVLISIPKHQYLSGLALGLSPWRVYLHIIFPQSARRLIPLAINLSTRMIKTTSLVVLIGVVEVLKVGQQIIEANRYAAPSGALWVYGAVFLLYFIACYPISSLARLLENKWKG